jgi:acetoin utilization deacetylase AcuC-like enzyme
MMRVSYTPRYYADIGEGHVFPIRKFELVRDRLLREGTLRPSDTIEPQPAPLADVLLVHTEDYVTRLRAGTLSPRELRRLGLPWSKALVRRSFLAAGGTSTRRSGGVLCRHERKLPTFLGVRPSVTVKVAYSRKMLPVAA